MIIEKGVSLPVSGVHFVKDFYIARWFCAPTDKSPNNMFDKKSWQEQHAPDGVC